MAARALSRRTRHRDWDDSSRHSVDEIAPWAAVLGAVIALIMPAVSY